MASSSISSAVNIPTHSCYEVFLNHRGEDTKLTFTSHLYHRLVLHGVRVFWDKEEMQVGDTLTSQIRHAVQNSSIHVAIFSRRYAESHWCLDELDLMVESGKPIIPVFHGVQPAEVRQTQGEGVYAQALRDLEQKRAYDSEPDLAQKRAYDSEPDLEQKRGYNSKPRYNSTTIEKWRKALSTVAGISGLELAKFNGDEGELLNKVFDSVWQKLKKTPRFDVAKHPTGLDEKITDFEKKVLLVQQQQSSKPHVVGVVGLGGMGKTTLVKELFNRKSSQYHRSCFLFDVRESARTDLLKLLQEKLLKELTHNDEKIIHVDEGKMLLKTRVSPNCQALVIIDDVDHSDQLDALLRPMRDVLHSKSLILVTSRDRHVLISSEVEESSIYKLSGLNPQHSRQLFCLHAFSKPNPLPGFEVLVDKYLEACNGLPLSLKVFGGLLYGNSDKIIWKDRLERLEQFKLPKDIQKSLQISYDALEDEEKHIFLDVACFFIGENRDKAIRIWNGSRWGGSLGFLNLQNKSLVEMDIENGIRMHDHLRDLGRDLAKNPALPRRIWHTEDLEDLLQQSHVVTEVRGISLRWTKVENPSFSGCKISNLRLLDINRGFLENDSSEGIVNALQSPKLIWLRLEDCGCSSLPSWIPMKELRVLEVIDRIGSLKELWQGESQAPLQLRELKIDAPSCAIPKSIELLNNLERTVISAAGIKF